MSKDYDTYINNESNKLNGYANYLLGFNKKYSQELYGLNSDIDTYNRRNREKPISTGSLAFRIGLSSGFNLLLVFLVIDLVLFCVLNSILKWYFFH